MKVYIKQFLVPRAGLEPATLGLEVLCSIHLSYRGKLGLHASFRWIELARLLFLALLGHLSYRGVPVAYYNKLLR